MLIMPQKDAGVGQASRNRADGKPLYSYELPAVDPHCHGFTDSAAASAAQGSKRFVYGSDFDPRGCGD
ncbi:hypothetical protein GCM10010946_17360 [Undibacterium squillarum]|uniref:Amidohydrolase n=1 Tax=Undibacterium squillarum TaxID=1131567 RepID=A0ABQ2XXQ7_9BURK|nr:hypothetical protein GCM10010946_17360 [Undibacterium squillarum]